MNKRLFFLILLAVHSFIASAQNGTITTIAGTGANADGGDDGPALMASFSFPSGICTTPGNDLYICDRQNNKLKKIDNTGTITTIAGIGSFGFSGDGGQASNAQLYFPQGVCVDTKGNVFVADINNNRVRMITPDGIINTIAGTDTFGYNGDGIQSTAATLFMPAGVAVNGGCIYIADAGNHRIRCINMEDGMITTVAGNGTAGFAGDGGPATASSINFPFGLSADAAGNVFVADYSNSRIRKINATGIITTVAGNGIDSFLGDGGPATDASLNHPVSVTTDRSGNTLFVDENNNRVRKVTPSGIINTEVGTGIYDFTGDDGPATDATLRYPSGIATDAAGSIYLADEQSFRIRKITYPSLAAQRILSEDALKIFPNPANDHITIQLKAAKPGDELSLYDATGALVKRVYLTGTKTDLDVSRLSNGRYYISCKGSAIAYNASFTKVSH